MTWRYRAESGTYECLVKNCEINIVVYVCVRANVSVDSRQYMVKACAYSCHHSVVLVLVASVNSVIFVNENENENGEKRESNKIVNKN